MYTLSLIRVLWQKTATESTEQQIGMMIVKNGGDVTINQQRKYVDQNFLKCPMIFNELSEEERRA